LNTVRDAATQLREGVRTLAAGAQLFADNNALCDGTLKQFAAEFGRDVILTVVDGEGIVRCANIDGAHGRRTAAGPLVNQSRRTGEVAIGFIPSPQLSVGPALGAVTAADAAFGTGETYVGATQQVMPFLRQIRESLGERPGFVALVDPSGAVLAGIGIVAGDEDARMLAQRVETDTASALRNAFRLDGKWAVATPLEEGARLYVVAGWSPAPDSVAALAHAGWALLGPLLLWLGAVGATWLAVEYFVARPLLVVEGLARSYARGEDGESDEALIRNAPIEIASLRRTLAAMAKTLRGREARIATALQEERALLLEVNHRVKNNLQMVASILSIQARGAPEEAEARGLARAQDRVQLLALAHARIYASGEVRHIALDQLATDIVRAMVGARGAEAANVGMDLQLGPVRVSADRAVPLAFLIGETVSSILDLSASDAPVASLAVTLIPSDDGGFVLELDASAGATTLPPPTPTSQRLIGAFARQIEAVIEHDPARPCFTRITCPNGLAD
jgi:two-component sensor histidine kinase